MTFERLKLPALCDPVACRTRSGYTYFIQAGDDGLVKIGQTMTTPRERLRGEWFAPSEQLAVGIAVVQHFQEDMVEALELLNPAFWAVVANWQARLLALGDEDAALPHVWQQAKVELAVAAEDHDADTHLGPALAHLGRCA